VILDEDARGLEKIKDRILEYLAVKKIRRARQGPHPLAFVGPPGVGKTSLGSPSRGRLAGKFHRDLRSGGMRDEAEIRGTGARTSARCPGQIAARGYGARGTKEPPCSCSNEVDKLGWTSRRPGLGPARRCSDPEQNATFRDHYLDRPVRLSRVLFITTANVMDTVPGPRCATGWRSINLAGYTEGGEDRDRPAAPRAQAGREHGLEPGTGIAFRAGGAAPAGAAGTPARPAYEASEREIASVCRKVARRHAEGKTEPVRVTPDVVVSFLGVPRFELEEVEQRTRVPGVGHRGSPGRRRAATCCSSRRRGCAARATLTLTGQLGDVMKESVQAALSWVRSHAGELGIDPEFWERSDVHVHVPGGRDSEGRALGRRHDGPRRSCRC